MNNRLEKEEMIVIVIVGEKEQEKKGEKRGQKEKER